MKSKFDGSIKKFLSKKIIEVEGKKREIEFIKPGTIITQPSGSKYEVKDDGSWRRI